MRRPNLSIQPQQRGVPPDTLWLMKRRWVGRVLPQGLDQAHVPLAFQADRSSREPQAPSRTGGPVMVSLLASC